MNNSTVSQLNDPSSCPAVVPILFTVALCIVTLASLIGNVLVTAAVVKTPCLRTSTKYYIINMAVSDLLCALTNWPLYATDRIISNRGSLLQGALATIACKLGIYLRMNSHIVSIFSLVLMAVDRFIATAIPLKAAMVQGWTRVVLLVLTWIVSLAMSFPVLYYTEVVEEDRHTFCKNTWSLLPLTVYYILGSVIVFVAPLVVIIILYSRIMKSLRKRSTMVNEARDNTQERRRTQNRNIMKIFKSIVCAFFICWTPFCVYLFLKVIYPALFLRDTCELILGLFYYVFPSLSTAVNPVILFSFSTNFREALKSFNCGFSCRCKCRISPQSKSVSRPKESVELQSYNTTTNVHLNLAVEKD